MQNILNSRKEWITYITDIFNIYKNRTKIWKQVPRPFKINKGIKEGCCLIFKILVYTESKEQMTHLKRRRAHDIHSVVC